MNQLSSLHLLYIFIGGGSGSLLRYLLGYGVARLWGEPTPWATWGINLLGSLLIGYLLGRMGEFSSEVSLSLRCLLIVGFCGGFTTFSTFSAELLSQLREGYLLGALSYVVLSVCGGLLAVYLGAKLAE